MAIKKSQIDTSRLSTEQLDILVKATTNIFFFSQFIKVIHPVLGKIPFLLYPYQNSTLYHFLKHQFNIVLKFRQAGITELLSMYALWFAMYHPNKTVIIISIKDRVAKRVLRKIKFMYKNLPPYLRTRVVNGRGEDIGTSTELEFSNGSIITSIPTTEDAGRSEAVSLLIIDEAAIVRWADRIWSAAFPTLSTGGKAILNSTAYGVGNLFHQLFVGACAGGNPFNPIRLHWKMHPDRYRFEGDYEWYNKQRAVLGPRKTAQEIDGDFLTSGNTVFDLSDIREIEDEIEDTVRPELILYNGQLKIFEWPKPGEKYVLAGDISTGRANDFTAWTILERKTGREMAAYKGKMPIDKAEKEMVKWAKKFNNAVIAPESNDIGLGLATNIQNNGYSNLYYSKHLLRKKGQSKPEVSEVPGWYTTKKNRPVIIAGLEEDIRNNTIIIRDKFFCEESYTFIYDSRNRPIAMNKDSKSRDELFEDAVYTDDAIFAKAIGNHVRKEKFTTVSILPK